MKFFNIVIIYISVFLSFVSCEKKINGRLTFYSAADNCPPSGEISFPKLHKEAGGIGTFDDPITIASAKQWLSVGKKLYVPAYEKYFIMEDECEECEYDFKENGEYHIDAWIGPTTIQNGTTDCEVALELSSTIFILNPNNYHAVNPQPFFNSNGVCLKPILNKCKDKGNKCGNTCQLPNSMSCENAAQLFYISTERFKELNPKIDCSQHINKKKTVCQSGTCGGP
ncbi:hypothetical protein ACTA71_003097 [Dictyostelium dimigraforme]